MKKCVICKEDKPPAEFNKNRAKSSGLQFHCRACSKIKSREHYHAHKQKYMDKSKERKMLLTLYVIEKLKSGCVTCGEKDPVVLDFDHLCGKSCNVADLIRNGKARKIIDAEINKCQILCANCHRRKTAKDNNWLKFTFSVPIV